MADGRDARIAGAPATAVEVNAGCGPGIGQIQGKSRFSGIATPVWWSPKDDGDTMFFVNPNELEREKSDRLQVAYDAKQQAIFVWYWFNF